MQHSQQKRHNAKISNHFEFKWRFPSNILVTISWIVIFYLYKFCLTSRSCVVDDTLCEIFHTYSGSFICRTVQSHSIIIYESLYAVMFSLCWNRYLKPAQFFSLHSCLDCKGHQHNKRTKIITMIINCDYAYCFIYCHCCCWFSSNMAL